MNFPKIYPHIYDRHSHLRKQYLSELVFFSQCALFLISSPGRCTNTNISQAVKDVRGSQDTLVDVFERIESFIRRLEIYAEVRPTTEMTETIILIMVEVISILGIATKEIKEGAMSEWFSTSMLPFD